MASDSVAPEADADTEALLSELDDAAASLDRLEDRVAEHGEAALDRVAGACQQVDRLFERYEDRATDYDDFEGYVEFQDTFVEFVKELPEDLPAREAFEAADDTFQKSRLKERDFEQAREDLRPARELADLHADLEAARQRYSDARYAVRQRLDTVQDRIDDLARIRSYGAVDLDAPADDLRGPIEQYNAAIREAFTDYRRSAPVRELLDVLATAAEEPMLDARTPPRRLHEYLDSAAVGTEPLSTLLEYADYSNSKLTHYVDDPGALKRHVGSNRTYLDRLDASPFVVAWPPPPASRLEWWARGCESVVRRFAPEDCVAALREVRQLPADAAWYGDRREVAVARDRLREAELDRLRSGGVADDLDAARERRADLRRALDAHPPLEER
jgi:hypothetical protein